MNDSLAAHYREARKKATTELAAWLQAECREEITTAKWDFPTPPQVRDIVASGRLRDSLKATVTPEGDITLEAAAPYATEVHEGGVSLTGQRFPGRPFTRRPLDEMPAQFAALMAKHSRGLR